MSVSAFMIGSVFEELAQGDDLDPSVTAENGHQGLLLDGRFATPC
jgi:hypothetical protein